MAALLDYVSNLSSVSHLDWPLVIGQGVHSVQPGATMAGDGE